MVTSIIHQKTCKSWSIWRFPCSNRCISYMGWILLPRRVADVFLSQWIKAPRWEFTWKVIGFLEIFLLYPFQKLPNLKQKETICFPQSKYTEKKIQENHWSKLEFVQKGDEECLLKYHINTSSKKNFQHNGNVFLIKCIHLKFLQHLQTWMPLYNVSKMHWNNCIRVFGITL